MKKLFGYILVLLMLASIGYSATPAKPYADLADNDVLTATWLIGTFNTIYNWAQTTNASVTLLMAGTSFGDPITASLTTTISSSTQYLIWDATTLNYVSMVGSGVYGFEMSIVGVATGGENAARFLLSGTVIANATQTAFIGDITKESWFTDDTYDASCSITGTKSIRFSASSPANVKWNGRLTSHEVNY